MTDADLAAIEHRLNRVIFGGYYRPDEPDTLSIHWRNEIETCAYWTTWEVERLRGGGILTEDLIELSPHEWDTCLYISPEGRAEAVVEWLTHSLRDMALLCREVRRLQAEARP